MSLSKGLDMGASPHAFAVVRGRGYRPEQVDRRVARLTRQSRQDWQCVAELTARAEELRLEAERLWDVVASRPPQTFQALGERARKLLSMAEAESAEVRAAGQEEARRTVEQAESVSVALRESAQRDAQRVRTEAAAAAARTVEAAKSEASSLYAEARAAAYEARTTAEETLREVSRHCAESMAEHERAQAAAQEEAERQLADRAGAVEAYVGGLADHGERLLAAAKAERTEAEEAARCRQEEALARGGELLAVARVREEGVERETERVLREHAERAQEMRQHMARVRSSLASLTGREPDAEAGADGEPGEPAGHAVAVPGQAGGRGR